MNVKTPDDPGRCFTDSEVEILSGLQNAEKATSAQQWRDDRDAAAGAVQHFDQALVSLMAGGSSGDKQLDQSVRPFLDRARSDKTARGRELARRVALDQAVRRGIGSDAMFGAVASTARPVLDRSLVNRICRIDADNAATHAGRPPRYSTQGGCRDGKRFTFPLEDPKRVDQLRAEVGMPTLAEYNARFTCRR